LIALLQRVSNSRVVVDHQTIGEIGEGILALVGVQPDDDESIAKHFISRILNYRIFSDADDKMNLSLIDTQGGLLLVPQFTLAANTKKGRRPSFASAASPAHGELIFESMFECASSQHAIVESGKFAADMQVHLINNGPVSFILD
jgi:D-tyrosyl-tRNA(Tyr) deacylase